MCGIVGFTGAAQAAPILLDGLAKLEYRGYDSAGLAVQNAAGKIEVVKAKGRLKVLSEMTDGGNALTGTCGIGHTRWATHGEPSVVNAHPHYSNDKKIAIVHNGIIENYLEIKERLTNKGFTFVSQTDTEVLAQLLDYYYMGESAGDPLDAIARHYLNFSMCHRFMGQDEMRGRKKYLADLAKEYKADGIIVASNKFCEYWSYERTIDTIVLNRDFGIPVCSIEKEYVNAASGQLRTRFQAFIESVEIKKIQEGARK